MDLLTNSVERIALADLLLIDGPGQQILGSVVDLQFVDDSMAPGDTAPLGRHGRVRGHGKSARLCQADLICLQRWTPAAPSTGNTGALSHTRRGDRAPDACQRDPAHARIPVCVVATQLGYAPMYLHLERLVGPA